MDKVLSVDKVFNVEILPNDNNSFGGYADFWLPARPYAFQDALQKARIGEDTELRFEICDYGDSMGFLQGTFASPTDARTLRSLNALTWRITEMTDRELAAFEGMVRMEIGDNQPPMSVERLYNLAHSVSECHVLFEVTNDEQLGRFYAEGGFMPELDGLPDDVLARLDYRKIGEEKRKAYGGVFLEEVDGYVQRDGGIVEAWKELNLAPEEPDYAALLELWRQDEDEIPSVTLKLPASEEALQSAMTALDVSGWKEVSVACLDCKVPAFGEMFAAQGNPAHANRVALLLNRLPADQAIVCKALLEAVPCKNLAEAVTMMQSMEAYTLTPELCSPSDYARDTLKKILSEASAEDLIPCVNLEIYGASLLSRGKAAMTRYGAIQRQDGQPLRVPLDEEKPKEAKRSGKRTPARKKKTEQSL